MAKHYSTRDFFRQMPNALLARYFQSKALFEHLDFDSMKETKTDPLFEAWLSLPDVQRNLLDAEMLEIFDMCNEKGFLAILDEARWQFRNTPEEIPPLVDKLSALSNHFERAMITFLDYNACWKGATRFHHADCLPYWRKRKNLPHVPRRQWMMRASSTWPILSAITFITLRAGGITVWWSPFAGVIVTISSPIRKIILSVASNGWMAYLTPDPTTPL